MPVKARAMKSVDQARDAIARGSGGGALTRIKEKIDLTVRFLGEPDTWIQYVEHYDNVNFYYPCADDGTCPGCADNNRTSKRFLVNAVDMTEKAVIALVLPVGLAEDILARYDRFNTIMDRTYDLSRTGSGVKDTKYTVDYREPKTMDLSRYEPLDLLDVINGELPKSEDVVDPDEDDDPRPTKRTPLPAKKATPPAARRRDDLEDDESFSDRPAKVTKAIKKIAPPGVGGMTPPRKVLRRPGA